VVGVTLLVAVQVTFGLVGTAGAGASTAGATPGATPGAADAAPPESAAFYYQQIHADTDLRGLAGADLVVTRSQIDEPGATARLHGLGAQAYRYVQMYWAPAGVPYDGIDLGQTPGWGFCGAGTAATLGRVDSTGFPWFFLDLNERAAWDYAVGFLQTVKGWGYDGIMLDRGYAATVAGTAPDGTRIWNRASTCTEDPVAPGARFADRYVAFAAAARQAGLEVMFNTGVSPYDERYRSRPDPADPRCDLPLTASAAAWAACPRLDDVAPVATSFLNEGFSAGTDSRFASDLATGAEAERRGGPPVFGLVKAPGTGPEERREAIYRWARAKLFPLPLAVNTGDDACGGDPGVCLRNGLFPELSSVRFGAPVDGGPVRDQCVPGSTLRCVYTRVYAGGRVVVNVTPQPRRVVLPAAATDVRDVGSGVTISRQCAVELDLPAWTARILVDVPHTEPAVSGYTADGFGGVHGFGDRCDAGVVGPYWSGWDIARGVTTTATGTSGYVLDGFGGVHPFWSRTGTAPQPVGRGPYWRGWDIARGVALLPDGSGGYVVDGFGGLHPFAVGNAPLPPVTRGGPYWPGWNVARGVTLLPDGSGGYVADGFGGLHPFAVGANPLPPPARAAAYRPGRDWVRAVALRPDGTGGYLLDGYGAMVPFATGSSSLPATSPDAPRWPGWSIARGVAVTP
jgi:hypothetical protein